MIFFNLLTLNNPAALVQVRMCFRMKRTSSSLGFQADSYVSPSLELDPSFAFIRGFGQELRGYQVLGTIDKNVLVLDRSTEETFVIKVSAESQIF